MTEILLDISGNHYALEAIISTTIAELANNNSDSAAAESTKALLREQDADIALAGLASLSDDLASGAIPVNFRELITQRFRNGYTSATRSGFLNVFNDKLSEASIEQQALLAYKQRIKPIIQERINQRLAPLHRQLVASSALKAALLGQLPPLQLGPERIEAQLAAAIAVIDSSIEALLPPSPTANHP